MNERKRGTVVSGRGGMKALGFVLFKGFGAIGAPARQEFSRKFRPHGRTVGGPARWSSYPQERILVILFAMGWPEDYCLLTPGRKSAWGVLSLGRTDVGE
jgi:hypothetical protein